MARRGEAAARAAARRVRSLGHLSRSARPNTCRRNACQLAQAPEPEVRASEVLTELEAFDVRQALALQTRVLKARAPTFRSRHVPRHGPPARHARTLTRLRSATTQAERELLNAQLASDESALLHTVAMSASLHEVDPTCAVALHMARLSALDDAAATLAACREQQRELADGVLGQLAAKRAALRTTLNALVPGLDDGAKAVPVTHSAHSAAFVAAYEHAQRQPAAHGGSADDNAHAAFAFEAAQAGMQPHEAQAPRGLAGFIKQQWPGIVAGALGA